MGEVRGRRMAVSVVVTTDWSISPSLYVRRTGRALPYGIILVYIDVRNAPLSWSRNVKASPSCVRRVVKRP